MKELFRKKIYTEKQGFTLVEVLVSITLFTVVAIGGISAVVVSKSAYEKSQAIKATSDSLMFVIEDISRTARLGDLYRCLQISGTPSVSLEEIEEADDSAPGQDCEGVSYEPFWNPAPGDPQDQIIYVFAESTDGTGALFTRSLDDETAGGLIEVYGQYFQRITPNNLDIDLTRSGFDVIGAEDFISQPRIIMRIHGTITERNQTTELSLQTTISQRAIRVEP
jgi:prepilin-type N-terminal cleavage/methylation domain-containing protein